MLEFFGIFRSFQQMRQYVAGMTLVFLLLIKFNGVLKMDG
jgi:hypothetical protein